jgi:hypothetical protein
VNQAAAPAPCTYSITPTNAPYGALGGTGTFAVSAGADCNWTAGSNANWITVTGASGTGNGVVAYSVAPNPGSARTGTITVAGQTFTVTQAALVCTYSIDPTSVTVPAAGGTVTIAGQTFTVNQAAAPAPCTYSITPTNAPYGALGGTGTFAVTAGADCNWTAGSNANWITVTGASGTGNGVVAYSVAPNLGSARTGTITVAGQTFTVTQAALVCTYTISPTSVSVDERQRDITVAVTAGPGCAGTATSNASWITITSGTSGTGNGAVEFRIERNTGDNDRTGTLTIAGRTFTVRQDADR